MVRSLTSVGVLALALSWACHGPPGYRELGLGHRPRNAEECHAKRGTVVAGDVRRCPVSIEVLDGRFLVDGVPSVCCISIVDMPHVDERTCVEGNDGIVVGNPGGSIEECPDGRELFGFILRGLEGAMCCGPILGPGGVDASIDATAAAAPN